MKEIPTVSICTAMTTEDVSLILKKIEDDLVEIFCDYDIDEQTRADRLKKVIDFVQDTRFDLEKGV